MDITYVSWALEEIFIEEVSTKLEEKINRLGARKEKLKRKDGIRFVIPFNSEKEQAELFMQLRDLGVAFSAGKEWCPVEIFEHLREKGLVSGKFKMIYWSGPGDYHIEER